MKALELANKAPNRVEIQNWKVICWVEDAVAELRRLAEVNAELLYALEEADATLEMEGYSDLGPTRTMIREIIAKAKEQQ